MLREEKNSLHKSMANMLQAAREEAAEAVQEVGFGAWPLHATA